ncbi:methyltransferase [Flindersiella endophytica]
MTANTEQIRSCYDAVNRGDLDSALRRFASDAEFAVAGEAEDAPLGGARHGRREVQTFLRQAHTVLSELHATPEEFLESGDRVVVLGTQQLRDGSTGRECAVEFAHAWRLHDGKIVEFTDYHDTAKVRRRLGGAEANTDAESDPLRGLWDVVHTGLGFWDAGVLMSAVQLGVFADLARRPDATLDELTERLGLHPRGARDFLDALVALRLLEREGGRYRNTAAAGTYLDPAKPESDVSGFLGFVHGRFYQTWADLPQALLTGEPQSDITAGGMDAFKALYADPERVRRFQRAMHGASLGAKLVLSEKFPWDKYHTVADIGSVAGPLLIRLASRHRHLRGIGFDLPPVQPWFEEAVTEAGLASRLRFQAGDFFTHPLPSADVIVLGHVLHDWDLSTKKTLLGKAFAALPPGGAVLVYDGMIDDDRRENIHGLLTSLHMLLVSPGGYDYTSADCLGWLRETGFEACYAERLAGPESMVVGHKPENIA